MRGFGFIKIIGSEEDIFVHISELRKASDRTIVEGEKLKFNIVETYKGQQAKDIETTAN
jgi:cold shock protein